MNALLDGVTVVLAVIAVAGLVASFLAPVES